MRALNPTLSKLSNTTTSGSGTRNSSGHANANSTPATAGITSDNLNRLSQPKLRTATPAATPAQRVAASPALRSASSEARPTNPKPRPSSRQSAISAISSHSNNANHHNNKLGVPGNQRTTAPEPLSSRRGARPPTIITTTVSRNPRLAVRSEPPSATKASSLAKSTSAAAAAAAAAAAPAAAALLPASASASAPAPAPSPRRSSARSTATAASDAAASRPALSPSSPPRLPSHARNDNATSMTQHPPTSKSGRMPYDRSSTANNAARPPMPTLSATASRGTNKAPITPKVATKPSQPGATSTASRTPLASRPQRLSGPPSGVGGPPRSAPQSDDDISSHISLSATPRSGTRQTRVDSAGSTPNGTPNADRGDGRLRSNRSSIGRLPTSPVADAPKRQHVTFNSMPGSRPHAKQETHHDPDSKFFYASNAKPSQQAAPPKPTLAKAPVFFYANGSSVDNKSHGPPTSAPAPHHSMDDGLSSKFMYANGKSELRPTPSAPTSRPSSIISTSSRTAPAGRSGASTVGSTVGSSVGYPMGQKPTSPIKYNQPAPMAEVLNGSQSHQHTGRPRAASPPQLGPSPAVMRRSSTGTSRESHSRSGSLVVGESGLRSPYVASGPSSPSRESASQPQPLTLASIIQAAEDFGDDQDESSAADDSHSDVQSPAKSTHSADKSTNSADPANDLVANARRERKVQDLQITNASLEAINRTLERQLRKQTSELRRFKRLSRSGRLSMIPAEVAEEAFAVASKDVDGDGLALSDLSEGEERERAAEGEEDDSLSDTDSASGALSPSVLAERDEKHLHRDEKRLQLDLSRHQELLIDSQKINQSIKRCLDWTEELIKEGRKALEYQVRAADVVIPGPRVLNPADEDDDLTQGSIDYEPGPDDTATLDDEDEPKTLDVPITPMLAGWKSQGHMDRDSGIGLPKERG